MRNRIPIKTTIKAAPSGAYSEATEDTFRETLGQLAKSLPTFHAELTCLVDEGRFHDSAAVIAVIEGGAS